MLGGLGRRWLVVLLGAALGTVRATGGGTVPGTTGENFDAQETTTGMTSTQDAQGSPIGDQPNYKDVPKGLIQDVEQEVLFYHQTGIVRSCYMPLVVMGTVTNLLNYAVFSRPQMRGLSTSIYLQALALADLGFLYFYHFRKWLEWMDRLVDMSQLMTDAYCKGMYFMAFAFRDFSNLLILCITVERLIILLVPLKARLLCTVRKSRITVVSMAILACLINVSDVWFVWSTRALLQREIRVCLTINFPAAAWVEILSAGGVVSIVCVLNLALGVIICCHQRKQQQIQSTKDDNFEQTRRLTTMLLCIGILFLVGEGPVIIYVILREYMAITYTFRLVDNGVYVLSGVNHCCNFFIYVLSGQRFRQVFLGMMRCRKSEVGRSDSFGSSVSYNSTKTINDGHI